MKLLDLIKQFGQANYNYGLFNGSDKLQKQYDAERMDLFKQITEQVSVEPEVKVQIAEKIKEVIQEKKNNIEEAIRNDDRYMKQCFDSELEAVEDLLERLQASNLSA